MYLKYYIPKLIMEVFMRQFLIAICAIFITFGLSFGQFGGLDFSNYSSIADLEKEVEDLNNSFHSGMNVLTWTEASAPSVIGLSIGVYSGFGGVDKNANINLKDGGFVIGSAGIQAGFGTAGFEIFARYLPEMDLGDLKSSALGFGLKYDISDMIPAPGFPSTSLFVDYASQDISINDIEMGLSSINIGTIVGYDLIVIGVYGKLAVELGNTEVTWDTPAGEVKGDLDSTGFRYAVGVTLFGFRLEGGGRGSSYSVGLGYGISL